MIELNSLKGTGSSLKLNLVSFDTSSSSVHLALLCGDKTVACEIHETNLVATGNSRQEAANLLIPSIDRLVRDNQWAKSDIDAIVVGSGPGSFTGIRTSIVTARALAQALMVPLLPVSLLHCYFARLSGEAVVALQAAIGFYFVAHSINNNLDAASEHYYFNEEELRNFLTENSDATHFGNIEAATALQEIGVKLNVLPSLENVAVAQGLIALHQLQNAVVDFSDDADTANARAFLYKKFGYEKVVPTYLRNPSVTIKGSIKKVTA